MRKPTLAVVLFLSSCSPEALEALERHDEQVNELSHHVQVRFDDGSARLTVTRKFRNDTLQYQELTRQLQLPDDAIATSLRVSTGTAAPLSGTLTTAEDAAARWDLLTSFGDAAPSVVAKLDWGTEGALDLALFGLAPGETATVEYDLELRPHYFAGELSFEYPRDEEGPAPEFLGADRIDTENGSRLRVSRDFVEPFTARWATYPLEVDRSLWRLELDVKAQLAPTPVRPNVVFVIDGSHSEGPEGIAAQLELIEPYLANVREAQVEVVIYRRFAERLFGRFVTGSDVARLLATLPPERLAPGNGSNLELGARLGAEALAGAGGVTSRMVIFTDQQLPFGFTNARAIEAVSAAPRDTIVHVVERSGGESGELAERRDDAAQLSPLAASTGGVFFHLDGRALDPVLSADTMLGLVRPIRIDSLDLHVEGVEALGDEGSLSEGSSIRRMDVGAAPGEELVITGKLWAQELRQVVRLDRRLADQLPGLSIGDDSIRWALSDDELRTVASVSHAVSPVTSFFSAPPDAAASTVGRTIGLGLLGSGGSIGCGGVSNSTRCGFGFARQGPDFDTLLRGLIAPAVNACRQHGEPKLANLKLEATGDEIVEVDVGAESPELAECLIEGLWLLRLTPEFTGHRVYQLQSLE